MRRLPSFGIAVFVSLILSFANAQAALSTKQAKELITRMAGFELPGSSVSVKGIRSEDDSSAEATVELKTAFRLLTNESGKWRVAEIRAGQDRWESPEILGGDSSTGAESCDGRELSNRPRDYSEPTTKRARCLIAVLFAVQLPSDSVRIKSISPMTIPLASRESALVEAVINLEVRFARGQKTNWVVSAVRTGSRPWVNIETTVAVANEQRRRQAQADLDLIASALGRFWAERHFYVVSESHAVLIDHLNPRYLSRVIRLDPWHQPYQYRGERASFTLRSLGPDRKENTTDDLVVSSPSR